MSASRLRWLWLLPVVAAAGYLYLEDGQPPVAPAEPPQLPELSERPGEDAFLLEGQTTRGAARPSLAVRAPLSGYGFCPDEEGAPLFADRPPLASLLSVEASELMDQVRSTFRDGEGSRELRRGLTDFLADHDERAIDRLANAPDRIRAGFDYATAATIVLAMQALGRGEHETAQRLADTAVNLSPAQTSAHVLSALAAQAAGSLKQERLSLERAYALSPDEPALALAVGEAKAHTTDLGGALLALDEYLEAYPGDVAAGQLRERVRLQHRLISGMDLLQGGGIQIRYPQAHLPDGVAGQLHDELSRALDDAAALTGLARRDELNVVVYVERADLIASTCVPKWTEGVFDGTLRLHVAAVLNARRRRRVVRHEAFHAQLRSQPLDAPHWFHEGVAQLIADEMGPSHVRSYRMMLKQKTYIPFASMEGSFIVIDGDGDARLAYHQSLAMVQMLLSERGSRGIADAVEYLQRGGSSATLFEAMLGEKADGQHLFEQLSRALEHLP